MLSFSERMQNTALRLLQKYGQVMTVVRNYTEQFDPNTSETIAKQTMSYLGYGNPFAYTAEEIDAVNILSTDIKMYFYSETKPEINDIFTLDVIDFRAQNVQTERAQGKDIFYIVQLRIG